MRRERLRARAAILTTTAVTALGVIALPHIEEHSSKGTSEVAAAVDSKHDYKQKPIGELGRDAIVLMAAFTIGAFGYMMTTEEAFGPNRPEPNYDQPPDSGIIWDEI